MSGLNITNVFNQSKIKKADIAALTEFNKQLTDTTGKTSKLNGVTEIYKKTMIGTSSSAKNLAKQIASGNMTIEQATGSINKMALSSKVAAVGMNILNAAMNMGIMLAITTLIQLAGKGLDALTVTFEEQQEKVDGLKQKFEECTSNIETLTSQLEENRKKIAEINKNPLSIVDNSTLTTLQSENAELERQLELAKQIANDTNKQLGKETSKLLAKESQKSEIKKTTVRDSIKDSVSNGDILQALGKSFIALPENVNMITTYGISEIPQKPKNMKDYVSPLENTLDQIAQSKLLDEQLKKLNVTSKSYTKDKDKLEKEISKNSTALKNNIEWLGEQKDILNSIYDKTPEQQEQLDIIAELENGYLGLQTLSPDLNTFDEIWSSKVNTEQKKEILELGKQGELTAEILKTKYSFLSILFESIGLSVDDVINKLIGMSSIILSDPLPTLPSLSVSLDDISSKTSILTTAWKEMNDAGELSSATISKLIETDANWINHLEVVDGQVTINKDNLVDSAKEIIEAKKLETQAVIESCEKQIAALQLTGKAAQIAAQSFIKSPQGNALVNGAAGTSGVIYFDQQKALADGKVIGVAEREQMIKEGKKANDIFDTMLNDINNFGDVKVDDNNSKTTDTWLESYNVAYAELQHLRTLSLIDNTTYYNRLTALDLKYFRNNEKYINEHRKNLEELYALQKTLSDARVADIEHEISIMSKKNNTEQQQIELYKQIQNEILTSINKYTDYGLDKNHQYLKELETQWYDTYDKIKSIQEKLIQNQIDDLNKQKDNYDKSLSFVNFTIDKEIESLEEQKKALQDLNKEQEKENRLKEISLNLAKAKEKTSRVYYENAGWVWKENTESVTEAEKELADFKTDEQIDEIDKQIDSWEKYKKAWNSVASDYENTQNELIAQQTLGADIESQILEQRLDAVVTFKDGYISTLEEIMSKEIELSELRLQNAEDIGFVNDSNNSNSSYKPPNTSGGNNNKPVQKPQTPTVKYPKNGAKVKIKPTVPYFIGLPYEYRNSSLTVSNYNAETKKVLLKELGAWFNVKDLIGYATGGVNDFTGVTMLHGNKNSVETVFNSTDGKKLFDYINKTPDLINNLLSKVILPDTKKNDKLINKEVSSIVNIANITLPNVSSGSELLKEIQLLSPQRPAMR